MQYLETTVTICSGNSPLALELVSAAFFELGLKGIVLSDPGDILPDASLKQGGNPRPPAVLRARAVTAYLEQDDRLNQRLALLARSLRRLASSDQILATITCRTVDEEDWSESWKNFFEPVRISPRLVVKPSWRRYTALPGEIIMELDPGMAFGTGTHPTTRLCLQMIEKYLKPGDAFLDVGTGSGILMIAAAGLGAETLTGIDNDPVAAAVARKNLVKNHPGKSARIITGNLVDTVLGRYDLVTANILAEVILALLDSIRPLINPGGIFIASGILEDRQDRIIEKMKSAGFTVLEIAAGEKWVTVVARAD